MDFGQNGTHDFIQYWSAFQIFIQHGNPYDPALLHQVQAALGQRPDATIMMWNPPWLLVLLAPILMLDFATAATVWFALNIVFYLSVILFVQDIYGRGRSTLWYAAVAGALFYPAWDCLVWGQMSLLLAFAVAGFAWAANRKRDLLAGAFLALLTIKIHIYYLSLPVLLWWVVKERRIKVVIGSISLLGALVLATSLSHPDVILNWLAAFSAAPDQGGIVPVWQWKAATLSGVVRQLLSEPGIIPPQWPMWAIPGITFALTVVWLGVKRPKLSLKESLPPLLCLSLFTAPYGWLYDQCILLLPQIALAIDARRRSFTLAMLIVLQIAAWITTQIPGSAQHYFVWFPPALLALWLWDRKIS